jgi:hypothetical protein
MSEPMREAMYGTFGASHKMVNAEDTALGPDGEPRHIVFEIPSGQVAQLQKQQRHRGWRLATKEEDEAFDVAINPSQRTVDLRYSTQMWPVIQKVNNPDEPRWQWAQPDDVERHIADKAARVAEGKKQMATIEEEQKAGRLLRKALGATKKSNG